MRLERFRRLQPGDYQDAPPFWQRALDPINKQFELLTTALAGLLSFVDNFDADVREIEVEHDTDTDITVELRGFPKEVQVHTPENYDYYQVAWEVIDAKTVRLKVKWDTDPGEPVKVRIRVLGE